MSMERIPRYLYKYRPFNINTVRVLNLSQIFYADPKYFNDPLDCSPTVYVDTGLKELENLLFKWILKAEGKFNAKKVMERHKYNATEFSNSDDYYINLLASSLKLMLLKEMGGRGVASLASKWNCPLMWSHYGDDHKGLCIEYEARSSQFQDLQPVNYKSSRSIRVSDLIAWQLNGNLQTKEKIFNSFYYSKAPQWKYEREWRDIGPTPIDFSGVAKVKSVIFGLRCDQSVIDCIVRLYFNCDYDIKFYSIHSGNDGFQLFRQRINTAEIEALGITSPFNFSDISISDDHA